MKLKKILRNVSLSVLTLGIVTSNLGIVANASPIDAIKELPIVSPIVTDPGNEITPQAGGYVSSTYTILSTISNYTSNETNRVLIDTYAPVGSIAPLTETKGGSISLSFTGSRGAENALKTQLGLTGSISYSYTKGYNIPIPAYYSYTHGRPVLKVRYRNRTVKVREVQKYWYDYSGTSYRTLEYNVNIKEPILSYIDIEYRSL